MPSLKEWLDRHCALLTIICVVLIFTTWGTVLMMNRGQGHYIGGVWWPYLSEAGKEPPEAYFFGVGLTIAAVLSVVIILHHSHRFRKLFPDKRYYIWHSWFAAAVSSSGIIMLAWFNVADDGLLHVIGAMQFACALFVFCIHDCLVFRNIDVRREASALLQSIKRAKLRVVCVTSASFLIYTPIGLPLSCRPVDNGEGFNDYSECADIHSVRAVCQHIFILSLALFVWTFIQDAALFDLLEAAQDEEEEEEVSQVC